jgi:hypothetical protein
MKEILAFFGLGRFPNVLFSTILAILTTFFVHSANAQNPCNGTLQNYLEEEDSYAYKTHFEDDSSSTNIIISLSGPKNSFDQTKIDF